MRNQVRVAARRTRLRLPRARRLRLLRMLSRVVALTAAAGLLLRRLNLTDGRARANLITIVQPGIILQMTVVLVLRAQLVNLCLQLQLVLLLGRYLLPLIASLVHIE